jgi:hypothetical protein
MKLFILSCVFVLFGSSGLLAQVRPTTSTDAAKVAVNTADREMLESIPVKYMGGLFGFSKKEHGTVKFDVINERLLFIGEDGKERFSLPYSAIHVVYPSEKKVQSGIGRTIGAIPILGAGLGGALIKKKKNYIVLNYRDTDVNASGAINFLVDTTELLYDSIYTIGENAEMKPRGDAYVRSREY